VESAAAREEARSSPEREQWCWRELPARDHAAPRSPTHGEGTPGLCSPLPAPGAGTRLSLCQLLRELELQAPGESKAACR